ncbi:leukocyte immunoglobulin-like receptor subfamily A member 5 isoform X2 [Cavia porcellus]|uniref:leukocyte immunoglobulin-like receptor subfamily A member 5 isoform X2 n=1 Tax=Cavia porcellus TaxID=10141 RepID=UPI002FE1B505
MKRTIPVLLYLGLRLHMAQQGPSGSVIPRGRNVSLWCQGIQGIQSYRLNREGRSKFLGKPNLHGNKAKFSILSMTRDDAGRYRCYYLSGADWSEPSEALELVVTGVYSKPSLSALPSTVVTSGANVSLQCATEQQCDRFILTKEGEANISWNLESRRLPNGQFQALFPVGPVILGPRLSFRCYSYDKESPHVWSIPSDPLEVVVSESSTPSPPCSGHITTPGCTGGPISPPTSLGSTADATHGHGLGRNLEVVIRISVAFPLLLTIVVLLRLQHQGYCKKAGPSSADTCPEDSHSHQAADSEGNQGVYAQLNSFKLRGEPTTTSSYQQKKFPAVSSAYAHLGVHQHKRDLRTHSPRIGS